MIDMWGLSHHLRKGLCGSQQEEAEKESRTKTGLRFGQETPGGKKENP